MPSPILARANALMHRHRSNNDDADEIPVLTDAVPGGEEIPLLTEIATLDPAVPLPALTAPDLTLERIEALPNDASLAEHAPFAAGEEPLLRELCRRVERRLAEALPQLIQATLDELLQERAAQDIPATARDLLDD